MFPQLGNHPYIIAEIGANHNGDMGIARKMIDEAARIGCDAVKFQSWDKNIFSNTVYNENRFLGDDYTGRDDYTLEEIVEEFALSKDQLGELSEYCKFKDIDFSSTPFTPEQIDDLVDFGVKYLKIASMDLTSDYMLAHAAETGLPILLSTGFGTIEEIDHAIRTIETSGSRNIVLLHCVSLYPPPDKELNLLNIPMLRDCFGYPVGFSDHTLGVELPLAAIALGAEVVEKHFTLDKTMFGWDHKISADIEEMSTICTGRTRVADALGCRQRKVSATERERAKEFRRSIVARRDLKAGEIITLGDLDYKRPGRGLAPNFGTLLIGRRLGRDILADELISWADLDGNT